MKDWLDKYLRYTRHQVSPEIYHRWIGLCMLGAAMERRCWLTRGYEEIRIYPGQLMVVLVGKSALVKKSTAIGMGTSLLKGLAPWQLNVIPKRTSPQQLFDTLARLDKEGLALKYPDDAGKWAGRRVNSTGLIVAPELGVFFSADAWNETMATNVSELNDGPFGSYPIKFRGWEVKLWNPLVGLIGGITPKGIAGELPKAARSAGFFGRVLWIWSPSTDRGNPLTERVLEERETKDELRKGIHAIARMHGPFTFTKQGKAWFEKFYWKEYFPTLRRMDQMGSLDSSGYWGRKDGHLLRVSMCCAAARSWGQERWIRAVDLERAHAFLGEIEKGFAFAMSEIGVAPQTEENQRVLGFVERRGERSASGWVSQHEISRYANSLGMRGYHLDDCLKRLRQANEIESKWKGGEHHWKRIWTSGALMVRAIEEGLEEESKR